MRLLTHIRRRQLTAGIIALLVGGAAATAIYLGAFAGSGGGDDQMQLRGTSSPAVAGALRTPRPTQSPAPVLTHPSTGVPAPAVTPGPTAPPTPPSTDPPVTYTDPFAFCAALGTVDEPVQWSASGGWVILNDRYTGPATPPFADSAGYPLLWRCTNAKVFGCNISGDNWCAKALTEAQPSANMVEFCQAHRELEGRELPLYLTLQRASIFIWACKGGAPVIVGQKGIDPRGFLSDNWYEVLP